ncbi:MAG: hypothetical protein O2780_05875 [Proteobacteria bacterium]|jgi:hypothetical protein|nr:hypothetical protein [Pseudomonadota bacterium]MDA1300157.1 hypothetical protein [Pseudomonadota bacterium]
MSIRMAKPWQALNPDEISRLGGQMGVYQLGDEAGNVLYIGVAGGRSLFGLRGEIDAHRQMENVAQFRVEITSAYRTRQLELLMIHQADYGTLPVGNDGPEGDRLGRLSPA